MTPKLATWIAPSLALAALAGAPAGPSRPAAAPAVPQPPIERLLEILDGPRADLLLLGTFHFDDAGLDDYKPKHGVAVGSEARQREIEALVADLAEFGPTRVAVEWPKSRQAELDRRYDAYRRGELELEADEIDQIGFRLARKLGHDRVHAVDVFGRHYEPRIDRSAEAARLGLAEILDSPWEAQYERALAWEDELKTRLPLQDFLLYLNDERRVVAGHGAYLTGGFRVVSGDEYPGPDHTTGWWYNRNLRIFANVLALVDSPEDRVFLLIGSGHLPILRYAAAASPEVALVEPSAFVRPAGR